VTPATPAATPVLAALRSGLSVVILMAWMVLGGAYQRLVIYPLVFLWPGRRGALTSKYFRMMSRGILFCMRLGGATLRRSGTASTASPVLVIMNHQSLLDIPTAGLMCSPLVPWFVTRKRYHYGIPAVSPCLRLMGCPIIEPRERTASLTTMREAARALEHGMLVFAEGHRSRDGEVLPFQTAGVLTVLRERHMPVCLVVTDGFWSARRMIDSVLGIGKIRGETEVVGVFEPPADDAALPAFVEQLRERMIAHLALMRRRRHATSGVGTGPSLSEPRRPGPP
jgi:1-acyl-sn-glycerol-3-phosphate acyltransferase